MPVCDGLQSTRIIRASTDIPAGRQPYIIAVTANAMSGDRAVCTAAGMDSYITKPITITAVTNAIDEANKQLATNINNNNNNKTASDSRSLSTQ